MNEIALHDRPKNDHGCHGTHVVIEPDSARTGIVVRTQACSTCVGDARRYEESFVGAYVELPDKFRGTWEVAEEVVPIRGSFSQTDRTKVAPYELKFI